MTEKYKKPGRYVTFIPTDKEFTLGEDFGKNYRLSTPDKTYLNYGFESEVNEYTGNTVYRLHLNGPDKLQLVSNAHKLHYEAIYHGKQFLALFVPEERDVTLVETTSKPVADSLGFKQVNKGEWWKDVDISEVELIPIKEPIDLMKFLPSSNN